MHKASNMEISHYKSPLGWIEIETKEEALIAMHFILTPKENQSPIKKINCEIEAQLANYFNNKSLDLNFKMKPKGTPFQQEIWKLVLQIEFGKTLSYSELVNRYGNKKAIRAVGSAIGKNPIMIFIPCHRVIGSNGSMVGYAGGIPNKKWLLEHEGFLIQKSLDL